MAWTLPLRLPLKIIKQLFFFLSDSWINVKEMQNCSRTDVKKVKVKVWNLTAQVFVEVILWWMKPLNASWKNSSYYNSLGVSNFQILYHVNWVSICSCDLHSVPCVRAVTKPPKKQSRVIIVPKREARLLNNFACHGAQHGVFQDGHPFRLTWLSWTGQSKRAIASCFFWASCKPIINQAANCC